jgi:pyridoxal phosphate enzyme (YggS family)
LPIPLTGLGNSNYGVKENIKILKERIEEIRAKRGIKEEIKIVAAAKGVPAAKIREAIDCGIKIIGENRVQEALAKYEILGDACEWHMIGHLQTNKVKKACTIFRMIQSVDSLRLAQEINRRAEEKKRIMEILIEVNTSKEERKFGLPPSSLFPFIEAVLPLRYIKPVGLMTLGPELSVLDKEKSRPCFAQLRELREEIKRRYNLPDFSILSMGMSSDYEVAIEEGSNMIRIGRAIFGERSE